MKFGIGTVQFGMDYGVTNVMGKSSIAEVREVLVLARKNGVDVLDTAYSYGCSEEVLGEVIGNDSYFSIITKTPIFQKTLITSKEAKGLQNAFFRSLDKLGRKALYGLLVHASDNLLLPGGELLWEAMMDLKNAGLVKKIGVSVYDKDQIDQILRKYKIDLIQVPINVFDQRLLQNGYLEKLKKLDIEIHARSVFLQGVLLTKVGLLPKSVQALRSYLQNYYQFVFKHHWTLTQAAIGFVLGIKDVDLIVVGIDNCSHLRDILNYIAKPLNCDLFKSFAINNDLLLNPSKWEV